MPRRPLPQRPWLPPIAYKAPDSKRGGKERERDTDSEEGDVRTGDVKGSDLRRKWSFWSWPVKGGLDFRFRMGKEIWKDVTYDLYIQREAEKEPGK